MENKDTTTEKTKPKDRRKNCSWKKTCRIITKKQEKQKRLSRENKEIPKENKDEIAKENNQEGSFSLTQILSVASIVVSLAGLYYKRKELMSFVKPSRKIDRAPPIREITEEDLEASARRIIEKSRISKIQN